jgi:hypothetical protein
MPSTWDEEPYRQGEILKKTAQLDIEKSDTIFIQYVG